MLSFNSPYFYYKMVFMVELLVIEGLTTYSLKKRKHFALRAVLSILGCLLISFLFPIFILSPAFNAFYMSFMFLFLFGVSLTALKICYNESIYSIIFCSIVSYTSQHFAYEVYNYTATMLSLTSSFNMYAPQSTYNFNIFAFGLYAFIYSVVYWFVWAFIDHKIRIQTDFKIDNVRLLLITLLIIIVDVVLNAVVTYSNQNSNKAITTVIFLYSILSCVLSLIVLFYTLDKKHSEIEIATINNMLEQDKIMFQTSKDNIEQINIKCHDLKHQIRNLNAKEGFIDQQALKEIENAVQIYDTSIKTGCDPLDIVLAEKSMYCRTHSIQINVMADGKCLNFMSNSDLYSLFGNALSNAIEALDGIEDKDKKIIKVNISDICSLVRIHIENYCDKQLEFVDNLPQTTKKDKSNHGFGVRSIQLIAEKYDGGLSMSLKDNIFSLDIVIVKDNQQQFRQ